MIIEGWRWDGELDGLGLLIGEPGGARSLAAWLWMNLISFDLI
jgi:hypothetical protein